MKADAEEQMRTAYRALTAQKARIAELEAALGSAREPVAIVGIGCRFPGGVRGPESFWQRLCAGFDAVREVPPERWPVDATYDPDPEAPGKIYTRQGAFLDEVDRFDAKFFGISPREAASMDPQQRLLLETAWEALEHAGIPPAGLAGSPTGVFVGLTAIDYLKLVYRDDLTRIDAYAATGNVANIAAGRLSYFFGLRGPAVTLDTACSSSLVAVHLACQSLRAGESTAALAAGVNLILAPDNSVAVARARMLSPGGSCRAFDAAADGYVRGEGCGVVVLKLLSRAQADGDRILAVVRGSAVGQDGARSGLTVPNGPAQAALIRQALANAGAVPGDVGYLEAHGTGTSLGDPIEAEALASVFGGAARRPEPLVLGSLKTNLGHMESAAGIGGLIKAVLAVRHGQIPPHLHFRRENPELRLAEIPARIPVRLEPWPPGPGRRLAGVSSFGSCGTIAHVLVEEAPAAAAVPGGAAPGWLFLSGKSVAALHELAGRTAGWLAALPPDAAVADICWTAAAGRTHFPHRLAVRGGSAAELAAAIAAHEAPPADSPGGRYLAGAAPDLKELFGDWRGRRVTLPAYPFARDRHWIEPEPVVQVAAPRAARPAAPAGAPDFGIMFFNGTEKPGGDSYRMVLEAARLADASGFSSVWAPERHFTAFGALYPNPALLHAALARETKAVRLMAGSCVLPLHDLLRVVEEWAMVDNLSGGRAGLSFASGWNPADFALAPDRYADRHDALFAGIAEARRLWRGGKARRRGGDGREVDVRTYPSPVQRELPLWVTAAGSPRTFERAGEAGANLLTHLLDQDIAALSGKLDGYRAARARAGHDPDAGRVTVMLHTFLGVDAAAVEAKARAPYCRYLEENLHLLGGLGASRGRDVDLAKLSASERAAFVGFLYDRFASSRALLGTPEACAPLVRQLAEAGVDEIACLLDFGPSDDDVLGMLPQLSAFKDAMQSAVRVVRRPWDGAALSSRAAPAAAMPDCFLEVTWRPASLVPNPPLPTQSQHWVVVGGGAVGAKLAERLRSCGQTAAQVSRAADLLGEAARIIDLQPLDAAASLGEAVALIQRGRGRLWAVTRGAQPAGGTVPDPDGAALWGLLRALPVEQPARWGGLVDLDPALPAENQLEALWSALTNGSREDQLAFRGGSWLAARLADRASADLPSGEPLAPAAAGAWLVTGGLGGLGWAVAEWLVARGARELLLLGRRGPDAARQQALEAWEKAGVRALAVSADCADDAAVAAALKDWRAAGGSPIAGVVHVAGAWKDVPLAELDGAGLDAVWRPKVAGALALERALAHDPVGHWIYFSAFSAVLPALGQGNYAAANAWLGAQARKQRAAGARALALDWGPWSGTGFALTPYGRRAHERLESIGIGRLRPAEGLAVLERALASGQPQIGAMPVDWSRLFAADPQARLSPMLAELAARHAQAAGPDPDQDRIAKALAACPPSGHAALLTDELRRLVGGVLRLPPGEVPAATALTELGVDSLMAIEIKNRLQRQAGIDVPLVELLRGPTVAGLAATLLPAAKGAALAHAAPVAGPVEEIEI